MPAEQRCQWNDLHLLLEGPEAGPYRRLDCRQRDSANAVLFWRGVPSQARAGNDLRTEVLSRRVLVRALEGAVNHHGIRMGDDLAEVVLRYGWAEAYGRRAPRIGAQETGIDVVGHEPRPAYPLLAPGPGWPPAPERPRFRYAPQYLARLDRLDDVQLARFRRDGGMVILAGYRIRPDSIFSGGPVSVAVVVSGSTPGAAATSRKVGSLRGTILAPASEGRLASLEVFDSSGRGLAVHRAPLDSLPSGISDLLLLADPEAAPTSLEEAAALAGTGWQLEAGGAVGLYWETYAAATVPDSAAVRISVEPARRGFLGRAARTLGLVGERRTLQLAWHQGRQPRDGVVSHSVGLDLGQLGRGRYRLVVEVEQPGSGPLRAERWIELVRPDWSRR
jgi:hypothetical protein